MTGYILTCKGETWQLPHLLSWEITRTDGESCDAAQVEFLYEPSRLQVLKEAVRLRLTEDEKTVYFGVVDEVEAKSGQEGRRVTLCSRGLQALLMDNELSATRFELLQPEDAIRHFVLPFGVENIRKKSMPPVYRFALETGNTAWQAIRGFCRHSGGYYPRFSADGTLLFEAEEGATRTLSAGQKVLDAEVRLCRYGLISRQVIMSAAYEQVETAENDPLKQKGVFCQKVTLKQGDFLKADWRTASQRLFESARQAVKITVVLAGDYKALPGDTVQADLPQCGVVGRFYLESITRSASKTGTRTTLTLEGEL